MNNAQLYFPIGMPTLAVPVGMLINSIQFDRTMQQFTGWLSSVQTRLDMLIAKFMEFDSRLTRVEERLENLR